MTFPCDKCGACCELLYLSPWVAHKHGLTLRRDGSCEYYEKGVGCRIYEWRPMSCRVDESKPESMEVSEWHRLNHEQCVKLKHYVQITFKGKQHG